MTLPLGTTVEFLHEYSGSHSHHCRGTVVAISTYDRVEVRFEPLTDGRKPYLARVYIDNMRIISPLLLLAEAADG